MNRQPDVGGIAPHLDRQRDLGNQVACIRPDDAGPNHTTGLRIEQNLCHALVAIQRQRATAGGPRELADFIRDALHLRLRLRQPGPGYLGIGIGNRWDDASIECPFLAGGHLGGHLRFMGRLVREHRLTDDVTDGKSATFVRI